MPSAYKVGSKSNRLCYFSSPKLMPCGPDPLGGWWCHLFCSCLKSLVPLGCVSPWLLHLEYWCVVCACSLHSRWPNASDHKPMPYHQWWWFSWNLGCGLHSFCFSTSTMEIKMECIDPVLVPTWEMNSLIIKWQSSMTICQTFSISSSFWLVDGLPGCASLH